MGRQHRARPEFLDDLEAWVHDVANEDALRAASAEMRVQLELLSETAGAPKPDRFAEWMDMMGAVCVHGKAFEDEPT